MGKNKIGIYRGLPFFVSVKFAWINDQVPLSAGEFPEERQLLNLWEFSMDQIEQSRTSENYFNKLNLENYG